MTRKSKTVAAAEGSALPRSTEFRLEKDPKHGGSFPFRVPSLSDEIAIAAERTRLTGGVHIDDMPVESRTLNESLAYMRILSAPENGAPDLRPGWWAQSNGGLDLLTLAPVIEYWSAGVAYSGRFHFGDQIDSGVEDSDPVDGTEEPSSVGEEEMGDDVPSTDERPQVIVSHGKRASGGDQP